MSEVTFSLSHPSGIWGAGVSVSICRCCGFKFSFLLRNCTWPGQPVSKAAPRGDSLPGALQSPSGWGRFPAALLGSTRAAAHPELCSDPRTSCWSRCPCLPLPLPAPCNSSGREGPAAPRKAHVHTGTQQGKGREGLGEEQEPGKGRESRSDLLQVCAQAGCSLPALITASQITPGAVHAPSNPRGRELNPARVCFEGRRAAESHLRLASALQHQRVA